MNGDGSTRLTMNVQTAIGLGRMKADDTVMGVLREYPALLATMRLAGVEPEFMECCRALLNEGEISAMKAYTDEKNRLALKGKMKAGMKHKTIGA